MFPYLVLGIAALVGGILLLRSFATANPTTLARVVTWLIPGLAVLAGLFLLVTGRPALAIVPLAIFLISLIRQLSGGGMGHGGGQGGRGGWGSAKGKGASEVETRFLRMTLDHETGAMAGSVLEGAFKGRQVEDLTLEQQLDLLYVCWTEDEQSARILETYLDRSQENWRDDARAAGQEERRRTGGPGARGANSMSRDEAYEILGLQSDASESEIREAHRKLMTKHHPDHGGSTYFAAKLNEAKEILLGR